MLNSKPVNWDLFFSSLRKSLHGDTLPSVSKIASEERDPFKVLISTIISSRTKDEVTLEASRRLFSLADTPETMKNLSERRIAECIYPAGFYTTKAKHIRKASVLLTENFAGKVPESRDDLLLLPGVGRKTANLVLNLGFGIPAICVDTHVHRISNRIGFVHTKSPDKTERALMKILPKNYWIEINGLFVAFGKKICTPRSPLCSTCTFREECPKIGVERSR